MNSSAQKHLARARSYVEKGEEFYRRAAEEIAAAQQADTTLTNEEVGEWFGKSEWWVRDVVMRVTNPSGRSEAYQERSTASDHARAKRVLREAPMEQVERIIAELPKERQRDIGAAGGHEYMKLRQNHEDREKNLTPLEHKEREAAQESLSSTVSRAVGGFKTLGVVGHLEQALEDLRELNADRAVPGDMVESVSRLLIAIAEEIEVARAMAGLETRS